MAKITDINSGEEYEDEESLTRAEKRMLAKSKKEAKKKKKSRVRKIVGRILLGVLTVVLVIVAILLVVYRDEINIDSFMRMISYISLEKDEDGQAEEIFYDNDDSNCFAQVSDSLLVCSQSSIQLFSQSGNTYISEYITMTTPTIHVDGSYAVVYDQGGTALYGIAGKQISYTETTEGTILNARVNSNGYLTLITKETGYKGVITVYDTSFTAKVQISISSSYVMDALVSEDGSTLAIISIGADDSTYATTVSFYDTSTGELIDPSYSVSGSIALDLRWEEDGLLLQMDNGIQYITLEEGIVSSWVNSDGYLRGYSFTDDGYQVMIWSTYQTGYQGNLVLVDLTGSEVAEMEISQEVYSVSTAENYIALLYTNELVIYDSTLTEYASLVDTAGSRQAIVRNDGSALLLGSESATLFVP